MLMLTTRIGENSKLVITGDLKQTDRVIDKNGLSDLINKVKTYNNNHNETKDTIEIIEFDKEDIERSKIVEKIIDIYQYQNKETTLNKFNNSSDAALIPLNRLPRNL